jgi:hypothetical protein
MQRFKTLAIGLKRGSMPSDNHLFPGDDVVCKNCGKTAERHSDYGDCPGTGSGSKFRSTDYKLVKIHRGLQRSFAVVKPDGTELLFDSPEDATKQLSTLQEGFGDGRKFERDRIIKELALEHRGSKTTLTVGFINEALRLERGEEA